jgi:Plasmid pRiA4b ORF-3-like protein
VPRDEGSVRADLLKQFEQGIAELGPGQLPAVVQRLLAAGISSLDPFARTPPPSRRRPRRADVVTYRVHIDLKGSKPPVWRRLELASDLFLDDLHDIVQAAFGWTDSHLHRFGSGPDFWSRDTEYYLCPFDVEEDEEAGVPEEEVRLDEVLVDVGDKLLYNYDFGDDWQHTIKLEAVLPRADSAPRAVCIAGRRPGPPENCGGVHSYEMIVATQDETHPDHAERAAEFAHFFGDEIDPALFELIDFDIDEINAELSEFGIDDSAVDGDLPGPLAALVRRVRTTAGRRTLRGLVREAALDEPVLVDSDTATRMVRPYTWLLDHVGEGVKLTSAGYLPPVHVEAAVAELRLAAEWFGKNNRESHTFPVLRLRESAQQMGLLRKYRGSLVATSRGRGLRSDPLGLWWHLAEEIPLRSTDEAEMEAGLLLLVAMAAQADDLDATVSDLLGALGWTHSDGEPLTWHTARGTKTVLRRLGCFSDGLPLWRSAKATEEGVTFSRAALQTWPRP